MKKQTYSMGINVSNHDRSAALLRNGRLVFAVSEERLDRRKHSDGFYAIDSKGIVIPPLKAINYCLSAEGISIDDIDIFVVGKSINNCKESVLDYLPIKDKEKICELEVPYHHFSHAASTFYFYGENANYVIVADEQGHWIDDEKYEMVSLFENQNNNLILKNKIFGDYDNVSLGMFYDFISFCLGFSDGGFPSAGKTMGLAAYGRDTKYSKRFFTVDKEIIKFNFNNFVDFLYEYKLIPCKLKRNNFPKRVANTTVLVELAKYVQPIRWRDKSASKIAFIAQREIELCIRDYLVLQIGKGKNIKLASAGGLFLNTNINEMVSDLEFIDEYYPFPAATDDGCAIGLAYYGAHLLGEKIAKERKIYLGRTYSNIEIENALYNAGIPYKRTDDIEKQVANYINDEKIVCLFNGGAEFGPRALGNRSILARPDSNILKDKLNLVVKHRELFRPLAPVVQEEYVQEYFSEVKNSPYMLLVAKVKDARLVGVTHADCTARVQTVNKGQNELLYNILEIFGKLSGFHICINTSFNVNNEPIVETPKDAIRNFILSEADVLAIGGYIVDKEWIDKEFIRKRRYEYLKFDKNATMNLLRWHINNSNYAEAVFCFEIIKNNIIFNELNEDEYIEYLSYGVSIYNEIDKKQVNDYIDKLLGYCYPKYNFSDFYKIKCGKPSSFQEKMIEHMKEIEAKGYIKYLEENV